MNKLSLLFNGGTVFRSIRLYVKIGTGKSISLFSIKTVNCVDIPEKKSNFSL